MKQSLNAITSTGFPSDRFAALSASSELIERQGLRRVVEGVRIAEHAELTAAVPPEDQEVVFGRALGGGPVEEPVQRRRIRGIAFRPDERALADHRRHTPGSVRKSTCTRDMKMLRVLTDNVALVIWSISRTASRSSSSPPCGSSATM